MDSSNAESAGRIEFTVAPDKHQRVVRAQRDFIHAIADRVERGAPIARAAERELISGILRAWARQLPDALPTSHEGTTKVDPGYAAIHFACLVNAQGRSKAEAMDELAEIYGVAPQAIADAIARFEAQAMRLVPRKASAS